MTGTHAITCIIPAYNASATLRRALRSVLAQTFTAWRAIIVDDGSTDDTHAVARSLAARDGRVRVMTKPNGGVASARNAALNEAEAGYAHCLDADDWLAPDAFGVLLDAAERAGGDGGRGSVGAAGSFDVVRANADPWSAASSGKAAEAGGPLYRHVIARTRIDLGALLAGEQLWTGALLVPAASLRRAGFDESLAGYEDQDAWLRMARAGLTWAGTTRRVAFHAITPGSITKRSAEMRRCGVRVLRRHGVGPRAEANLALAYATAEALEASRPWAGPGGVGGSRNPAHLGAIADDALRGVSIGFSPVELARAGRFAVVYHLGLHATPGDDAAWWRDALESWWAALIRGGRLRGRARSEGALASVRAAFCAESADGSAVAPQLLAGIGPERPLVIIGHGKNGQALVRAAIDAGLRPEVRDDRFARMADDEVAAELPGGVPAACVDDPIHPGSVVILTPGDDAGLLRRLDAHGAEIRRWREALGTAPSETRAPEAA